QTMYFARTAPEAGGTLTQPCSMVGSGFRSCIRGGLAFSPQLESKPKEADVSSKNACSMTTTRDMEASSHQRLKKGRFPIGYCLAPRVRSKSCRYCCCCRWPGAGDVSPICSTSDETSKAHK